VTAAGERIDARRRTRLWLERVGASADCRVALASVGVAAVLVWLALPAGGERDLTRIPGNLLRRYLWELVAAAAIVAVAPSRWRGRLQSIAVLLVFLAYAIDPRRPLSENVTTAILWGLSGVLAWRLPLHRVSLRRSLIVVVTLGMVALARRLDYSQGILLLQFLFVCEVMATRPDRSWLDCQRATSVTLMNVPPEELVSSTRAPSSIWLGAILIVGGLAAERLLDRVLACGDTLYFYCTESAGLSISDAVWSDFSAISLLLAALRQVLWLAYLAPHLFIAAGVLRFLGVPVSMPMGNLLGAGNLFEYWKRANTWRYRLLRTVYIDNFLVPDGGLVGTLALVVVFLLSGLHHAVGAVGTSGALVNVLLGQELPWLFEGILVSVTFQWLLYRMRRRVREAVLGRPRSSRRPLTSALVAVACLLAVLSVEGLLTSGVEVFASTKPYWVWGADAPDGHTVETARRATEVRGASTIASPAIAADEGATYAAWRGSRGDPRVFSSTRYGTSWTRVVPIPTARSDFAPALTVVGPRVVLAWTEDDGGSGIHWTTLERGGWREPANVVGARSGDAPALASFGDTVCVAWRGVSPDRTMAWTRFTLAEGSLDEPRSLGSWETSAAPALAGLDGSVYVVWRGVGAEEETFWWSRLDGTEWAPRRRIEGTRASSGPSLVEGPRELYLAWRGREWDARVHWMSFTHGTWGAENRTELSTCDRPGIAAYGRGLAVATRGRDSVRCGDSSGYGGDWDVTRVWATGVDVSSRGLIPLSALREW
jgi:hypothetical protein